MQNWWEILGVEQGTDLRSIKRAYAAQLKILKNNDNPYAFMELREAYEGALKISKSKQYSSNNLNHNQKTTGQKIPNMEVGAYIEKKASSVYYGDVIDEVYKLMEQSMGGHDVAGWSAIFADDRLIEIDNFIEFEREMFNWLVEIHVSYDGSMPVSKLSREVGSLVYEMFGWKDKMQSLDDNAVSLKYLARIIKPKNMSEIDWFSSYELMKRDVEKAKIELKDIHNTQDNFNKVLEALRVVFVVIPGLIVVIVSLLIFFDMAFRVVN